MIDQKIESEKIPKNQKPNENNDKDQQQMMIRRSFNSNRIISLNDYKFTFMVYSILITLISVYFLIPSYNNNKTVQNVIDQQTVTIHDDDELEDWVRLQTNRSWETLLTSFSPEGALPGMIVASLSTCQPDYFYSWTRDSAIVLKEIVSRYNETNDPMLLEMIHQSINITKIIQKNSKLYSTVSLAEPKFYVDSGQPYLKNWGRPQIDGIGLRSIVYIKFVWVYLFKNNYDLNSLNFVKQHLYDSQWDSKSIIKADLEYISNNWKSKSFDLWEEIKSKHFFTLLILRRSLLDGIELSKFLNDFGATDYYYLQFLKIDQFIKQSFWNDQFNYILSSLEPINDSNFKRSWLDVGTILGCLHSGTKSPDEFRPNSTKMFSTYEAILNSMKDLYPISKNYQNFTAKPIGRYPEDVYDGIGTSQGNPWYLTTLTLSEYLYRYSHSYQTTSSSSNNHHHQKKKNKYFKISNEFLLIIKNHIQINGSIHEQFHRSNGLGLGARDLTWSHVAFLSMVRARLNLPEF